MRGVYDSQQVAVCPPEPWRLNMEDRHGKTTMTYSITEGQSASFESVCVGKQIIVVTKTSCVYIINIRPKLDKTFMLDL